MVVFFCGPAYIAVEAGRGVAAHRLVGGDGLADVGHEPGHVDRQGVAVEHDLDRFVAARLDRHRDCLVVLGPNGGSCAGGQSRVFKHLFQSALQPTLGRLSIDTCSQRRSSQ